LELKVFIGRVSENVVHDVTVYPSVVWDLQDAAFNHDGVEIEMLETIEEFGLEPRKKSVVVSLKDLKNRDKWSQLEEKLPNTIKYMKLVDETAKENSRKYKVNIVFYVGYGEMLKCREYTYFTAYEGMDEDEKLELIRKHATAYIDYNKELNRKWKELNR
jgi:sRNA-binding regulator protein Hfq